MEASKAVKAIDSEEKRKTRGGGRKGVHGMKEGRRLFRLPHTGDDRSGL